MRTVGHYLSAASTILRQQIAQYRDKSFGVRKILIFESDDWGSIRVPSMAVHDQLIELGYALDSRPYERFDGLESDSDVRELSELLCSFRDRHGNHPMFTLNYLSANPDFDQIEESNFREYHWQPIDKTYTDYDGSANVIDTVKFGVGKGCFALGFHGREHFATHQWLNELNRGGGGTLTAFRYRMCGIFPKDNPARGNKFMVAMNTDEQYLYKSLKEGLSEFSRIWDEQVATFIAPCYTWPRTIEPFLSECGIRVIQGSRFQRLPSSSNRIAHHIGQRNTLGMVYTVRNCAFEPATTTSGVDVVEKTVVEIRRAFRRGIPAIVSTHRINYTSRLSTDNAHRSRELLKNLLSRVLTEFPDVEFSTGTKIFLK